MNIGEEYDEDGGTMSSRSNGIQITKYEEFIFFNSPHCEM